MYLKKKYYFYFNYNSIQHPKYKNLISMNIKPLGVFKTYFLLSAFLGIFVSGCVSDKGKEKSGVSNSELSDGFDTKIDDDLVDKINTAKRVFYSLPSPLETAILIKSAGASYDASLLNPVNNASKYDTNLEMALNLGIYSTNLSYASLFDQSQATLDYINAAKKMADGLSILDAIDEATVKRLEENINNRDVIIDIISETLLNSNSFLEDKGLQGISAIILVGGWVEGLYISTNLVKPNADLKTDKLVERIVDQKLTLDIVLNLLENNKDNMDVQAIMKDVLALQAIYDKISINQSEITVVEDSNTQINLLKSDSSVKLSPAVFKELAAKVKEIRTRYIS